MLTAAVSAGEGTIAHGYDIAAMSKPLDYVNLMAYDLHGSWEQMTGINAPLFASRHDVSPLEWYDRTDQWIFVMADTIDSIDLISALGTFRMATDLYHPN